jgi:2-polyprenyl-3-methyl-5-hydroxy-6-metoxy-1,4-benzoquinol methylase
MSNGSEKIIDIYRQHAHDFDGERSKALLEAAWLDRFLALVPEEATILDIGCGSGEPIARAFIEKGYAVTGVDASAPLIDLCKERFPQQTWMVCDMRELALGQRFDGLVAWHSFFHLARDDQRQMFAVFAAHANDNAALMFTAGPGDGEAIGTFHGKPLFHASLARSEYESLLAEFGFHIVSHVVEDPDCGGATIYLAQRKSR